MDQTEERPESDVAFPRSIYGKCGAGINGTIPSIGSRPLSWCFKQAQPAKTTHAVEGRSRAVGVSCEPLSERGKRHPRDSIAKGERERLGYILVRLDIGLGDSQAIPVGSPANRTELENWGFVRLADNPTGIWLLRKSASQFALSET